MTLVWTKITQTASGRKFRVPTPIIRGSDPICVKIYGNFLEYNKISFLSLLHKLISNISSPYPAIKESPIGTLLTVAMGTVI